MKRLTRIFTTLLLTSCLIAPSVQTFASTNSGVIKTIPTVKNEYTKISTVNPFLMFFLGTTYIEVVDLNNVSHKGYFASYVGYGHITSGDQVKTAQYYLNKYGYGLSTDGQFGAKSQSAIVAFQKAHSLSADGIIGSATWHALWNYLP